MLNNSRNVVADELLFTAANKFFRDMDTPKSYDYFKIYNDVEETDDESYTNNLKVTKSDIGEEIVVQVKNDTNKEIGYFSDSCNYSYKTKNIRHII